MRRLTESASGILLLGATFVLGAAGLAADLANWGDPPTLFGGAFVAGIAAVATTMDEHRRSGGKIGPTAEILFGRVLVGLALLVEVVALVLGVQDSPYRNLWLLLAIIVALDGLAVVVDTRRRVVARAGSIPTDSVGDALPGVIAGAFGLGLGMVGFIVGLFDNPHAPAWLYAGAVLALLANALMYDEHAHVSALIRHGNSASRRGFKNPRR